MNKRNIALVLAILVLATASTWAQGTGTVNTSTTGVPALGNNPYGNVTGAPTTSSSGAAPAFDPNAVPKACVGAACYSQPNPSSSGAAVDVLGGHGSRGGCMFCHTPHSTGRVDATATASYNATGGTVAGGPYGTSTTWAGQNGFTWQAATVGQSISGGIYLWGRAMTNVVYKTWDGKTQFGGGTYTADSPEVHTLLCMTCHDNSMSGYAMTANITGQHGGWGTPVTTTNGSTSTSQDPGATAISSLNGSTTTVWGQGDLSRSHPVHTKYSGSSLWKVSINSDKSVSYQDADTNQIGDSGFYGHPARLYSDGTDVYVECTSCHNPHRQTSPAYKMKSGGYTVGAFGTTEHYIRGPYSDKDGTVSAGFCRSCHYSKSPEYIQHNGDPQ